MPDFDPRDFDSREHDDGVHDREDQWQTLGRGGSSQDVFRRDLDLPRGHERELAHDRDREYTLNGSKSRARNSESLASSCKETPSRTQTTPRRRPRRASHCLLST